MSTTVVADQRALFKYKRACMYRNQFKLRVELIELLIKHESCRMGTKILRAAIAIANIRLKITGIPRPGVNPRVEMIDSLGSMFRCFVLARAGKVANRLEVLSNSYNNIFVKQIIFIAGYSYQSGHSKKLRRALLSALNVNSMNRLRRSLYERQKNMNSSTSDWLRTSINSALKCVQEIETPFSLQILSHRAINIAILVRSLDNTSLESIKLPVHLKKYVLHQE